MTQHPDYLAVEPALDDVQQRAGRTLLEFGAPDCGICIAAQPMIRRALDATAGDAAPVTHLRIHDGAGRPLGRHFGVKLWPTLVLLEDGEETGRLVRPSNERALRDMLAPTPRTSDAGGTDERD